MNWVELLAYLGAKYGGDFSGYKQAHLTELAEKLVSGETTMQDAVKDMKYYSYYREAYGAVLDGWVGEYQIEQEGENGQKEWADVYGLKAFSPIARIFRTRIMMISAHPEAMDTAGTTWGMICWDR